jgi:hypothetical protein
MAGALRAESVLAGVLAHSVSKAAVNEEKSPTALCSTIWPSRMTSTVTASRRVVCRCRAG